MAKEVNKRLNIWVNGQEVENNIKSIRAAISKVTNELNKATIGSKEYVAASEKLRTLRGILDEHTKSLKNNNRELKSTLTAIGGVAIAIQTASAAMRRFVSATQEYVEAYATLDDAMTSVSKYTGLTREEVKQLNEEFRNMDTRTATEKLNALAADAGRLGITSKEAIKDFVEAADIINVALGEDLGEDAVKEIGKLADMFGTTDTMGLRGAMLATGSAINTLAQSSSASERYLMDFTSRLSGAANQAKMSQAEVLGFASVLDQNKQQVEMSATAMQKLLMNMFIAPEKYARLAGISVQEFSDALKNDANNAILTFLDTLNKKGGLSELAPIFKELGLDGARASGVISVLANKIDDVREAQELANKAFKEGTSVIEEAAAVNGNAAAQLDKAKKAVQDAKAALGEELIPVITRLTQASASGLKIIAEVLKFSLQHKGLIIAIALAYGSLVAAQKLVIAAQKEELALTLKNTAVGKAYRGVVLLLSAAKASLAGNTTRAAAAQKMLKAEFASTPWGAIAVAIGAVVLGIVKLAEKNREAAKSMDAFTVKAEAEKTEVKRLFDQLGKTTEGSEEYRAKLKEISDLYPEIIAKHTTENGLLDDQKGTLAEICTLLERKIALQMSEEERTAAIRSGIEKQTEALRGFNSEQQAVIKQMAESGATAEEIGMNLGISYYFTDFRGNMVKDDRFQSLTKFVEAYQKMKQDVDAIDKKYSPYISSSTDSTGSGTASATFNDNREQTEAEIDEKIISKRDAFLKKLAQMQQKEQVDLLSGWEKTKQQLINQYAEMEDEAKKLYGSNSDMLRRVQDQRDQAIADAGQRYIVEMSKTLGKSAQEIEKWKRELAQSSGSDVMDAVIGVQQKWAERSQTIIENIENVKNVRNTLTDDDPMAKGLDETINKLRSQLGQMTDLTLQDIDLTIQKYESSISTFIQNEQKAATESTMSESERQKAAIKEKYNLEIKKCEEVLQARLLKADSDEEELQRIRKQIALLKKMQSDALSNVDVQAGRGFGTKSVWQELSEFDWSNLKNNWQEGLGLMTSGLNDFASTAMNIFGAISQMQSDYAQAELNQFFAIQDDKATALKTRLDQGLISQEYYNSEIAKMEEGRDAKEKQMKHQQFERERESSLAEVVIQGGIAVARAFADYGWPWGLIPAAFTGSQMAIQSSLIASQVNPYAKGGFIDKEQLALMGEEGTEWVASNRLLSDKKTAPVISALERYQRGDNNALDMLSVPEPIWEKLSQSGKSLSRTFAMSSPVNYYYNNSNNTTNNNSDNSELLDELRKTNNFLQDPKNRQAVISRKMQLEFESMETEIKDLARL